MTNPSDWLKFLKSWPLLIAAVIAIAFGVGLTRTDEQRVYIAASLLAIGCVLLGAWIVLLVLGGHKGEDSVPPPRDDEQG